MVVKFNNWLNFNIFEQGRKKLKYPDLFNGYEAKDANVELAEALTSLDYIRPYRVELDGLKHSLFRLGEKWDKKDILDAVKALFQSLESENLLENFKIIEVICGGNVKQLRYYLTNMLVFNVIPLLISWVLHRNQDDALDLAREIMQLDGFTNETSLILRP
ncbi:hypothetical protein H4R34_005549 [Dimargaris verticillata]|uniref:Uncharacterized protein n=1 Tax=Dimargaris verticillata TaxID=2761393 RepID=A0A9W8B217_9FUNG|nr:hypothetical protein H4R34_005549 [Dimargaris verticillata]